MRRLSRSGLGSLATSMVVAGALLVPLVAEPAGGAGASTTGWPCPTVVTQADSGRIVSLALGTCARLKMEGLVWSTPTVSGSSVRLRPVSPSVSHIATSPAGPPTVAGATYIVQTEQTGRSTLTSFGRPLCEPYTACPTLVVLFRLTIEVSLPEPAAPRPT